MNLGILKLFKLLFIAVLVQNIYASNKSFDFDLIKKGQDNDNTLLIVGGIQGDEPGGFMAASLISTHYKIQKGSVWVIPNLNFYSIIKRSRGPFGDMNRKFAKISHNDPDYDSIKRIKKYISGENVKLVLNLHDGSGFYRKKYIDSMHSPYRWGQSSIIDQANLDIDMYGNLEEISQRICEHVNNNLIKKEDSYLVHNTKTKLGDKEMEKTLTYFAINNGKAAFGNEASKSLPVHERAYYHLLALEEYMRVMGIEFTREFDLTPREVKNALNNDIYITFYDDKIKLPLSQIRNYLKYFPIKKDGSLDFTPSNPLTTVIKKGNTYTVHYGNRRMVRLKADYLDMENKDVNIQMNIDGNEQNVEFGSIINAVNDFSISAKTKYRVNVIGYKNKKQKNESGLQIKKQQILKRYSIDKKGQIYRVEFYNNKKFAGMILVNFNPKDIIKAKEVSIATVEENKITSKKI